MGLSVPHSERFLDLLDEFYGQAGNPLGGDFAALTHEELPPPYRQLLAHDSDMTSTLERYHEERIQLRVLERKIARDWYSRHIVLETTISRRPVEYGAIRICLPVLTAAARSDVLEERKPLGAILNHHHVAYQCRPAAFFRVQSNRLIEDCFGLTVPLMLHGRCNSIFDNLGRPIAEVVEILPPEPLPTQNTVNGRHPTR